MDENNQRRMNALNQETLHTFFKGWQKDFENHAERNETYDDAWNGRLYSENGVLSYASIQGTRQVYENLNIVKYNGWYAFKDELIVIGKGLIEMIGPGTVDQIITEITVDDFELTTPTNLITGVPFSSHYISNSITVQVPEEVIDENDFVQNVSDVTDINQIDDSYSGLFKTFPFLPSTSCVINDGVPINNETYKDFIMSLTFGSDGNLVEKFLFVGNLNIPLDAVITTIGIEENTFYKRVYFSDYYNPTRVVNIKNPKLSSVSPNQLNIAIDGVLLNPRIKSINKNGQLKAMTVFYTMVLITENGQVSDYSPLSKAVKISNNDNVFEYEGGDVSEITNKSVTVECFIPNYKNFKDVQLVAIEFEAENVPTTIRLIGTKSVNAIVEFEHFGSEPEFADSITIADIFANGISWKYNSDFETKNNKLIVTGLRNDPSYINSKNIALDFSLNGFTMDGSTHTSLLNPDPTNNCYIDSGMTDSFMFVKRKLFRTIEVFGNFKMKLENTATGQYYEFIQNKIEYRYVNYTAEILSFLNSIKTDVNFNAYFPNLDIIETGGKILFKPINIATQTDFYDYNLTFTTSQVIIDMDNDIDTKDYFWPPTTYEKEIGLVYGGVSNGWFNGNGVKVTMHSVKDNVCSKNTDWMVTNSHPLQIKEPSLKRGVMKGEIYRLGIQWFKNGNRLFTTVLGDLKIPDIGAKKRELNESGKVILSNETYSNWSVDGNEMYAERIELQFDVRINCALSKEVDSYQIVYVERSESNRTILAQGISAPLERVLPFTIESDVNIVLPEIVTNKWGLPSNGGPVYDALGFTVYDLNPNNVELFPFPNGPIEGCTLTNNIPARIATNRKSFFFDSPDFIYNKISDNYIESASVEYIETIATDHDRHNILGGYNLDTCGFGSDNPGTQCYFENGSKNDYGPAPFGLPKFSQKIPSNLLSGTKNERPFFVNVSVFANRIAKRSWGSFQQNINESDLYEIDRAQSARDGEILSSYKMNENFDFSNNALSLAAPGWVYQITARKKEIDKYTLFHTHNVVQGRNTIFIKTKEGYFKPSNIIQPSFVIKSQVNFGTSEGRVDSIKANDAYIVSNLRRNNADSIYGGRSEFAYASNEYIAMGEVMPVISNRIASQVFYVEGDTYCNLYIRNKANYNGASVPEKQNFQWSRKSNVDNRKFQYNKYNAWCYAVVLESTVEPRLNNSEEFYKFSSSIDFKYSEEYNTAYLQENNIRKSIPQPYNFKDDPVLNNIVAVSKTKLNGDFIDSWTQFLPNEFYELDKDKGSALNIVKQDDELYVIQELQTSKLQIDERSFITPDNNGEAIQIKQGDGSSISGHTIISDFGTSFRRAIVDSPFGFVFFDERKSEFVKIIEPLFLKNNLLLSMKEIFDSNKVIDVTGYYDEKYKETNVRFRTESGFNFVVSYNELLKCFNGRIEYDNDVYMVYDNKVIAPYMDSTKLGRLNIGSELQLFQEYKKIRIKVVSSPEFSETKINKGIAIYINTKYPIIKATFETSLGHLRTVLGTHHWYKNREGVHTIPTKNPTDYGDIRGEWCSIEIETESIENKKINIFSIINYFRTSYK